MVMTTDKISSIGHLVVDTVLKNFNLSARIASLVKVTVYIHGKQRQKAEGYGFAPYRKGPGDHSSHRVLQLLSVRQKMTFLDIVK